MFHELCVLAVFRYLIVMLALILIIDHEIHYIRERAAELAGRWYRRALVCVLILGLAAYIFHICRIA